MVRTIRWRERCKNTLRTCSDAKMNFAGSLMLFVWKCCVCKNSSHKTENWRLSRTSKGGQQQQGGQQLAWPERSPRQGIEAELQVRIHGRVPGGTELERKARRNSAGSQAEGRHDNVCEEGKESSKAEQEECTKHSLGLLPMDTVGQFRCPWAEFGHNQVVQHWFFMARTGTPTKGHERERIQTRLCAQELRDEAARAAWNDVFRLGLDSRRGRCSGDR